MVSEPLTMALIDFKKVFRAHYRFVDGCVFLPTTTLDYYPLECRSPKLLKKEKYDLH